MLIFKVRENGVFLSRVFHISYTTQKKATLMKSAKGTRQR